MRKWDVIDLVRAAAMVAFGVVVLGVATRSEASALTRWQANRIALVALGLSRLKGPVVVYGLPQPLGGSEQVLEEGVPPPGGRRRRPLDLKPAGRQWLFFEDLAPGADFNHPGRLLFVSDRSGRVSASIATQSYPLVAGRAPFIEPGAPRSYVVLAHHAAAASFATIRRAPSPVRLAPANALPSAALAGACVLTVGDEGPDHKSFGPDLKAVRDAAVALGVPVYPLPARSGGRAAHGSDLPGFAGHLAATKGCRDVLILLAGRGVENRGVDVGWDPATNASHLVTPVNLVDTVHDNPRTTFEIIIVSCFSGQFARLLPASLKNLLVLSVSSSATQFSFGGAVTDIATADGTLHHNPHPSASGPAGFVANFVAGWNKFAHSASDIAAAQASGGSLFARMIARGTTLGDGRDWPASIGATTPMTLPLNLPEASAPPSARRAPSNIAAPLINGTTTQGDTLTTTAGTWTGNPTSYAYEWQDCRSSSAPCSTIAGATSSSYTLQMSDVGDTVDAVVTALNARGTATAASAVTATVAPRSSAGASPLTGLHVSGNKLVDATGTTMHLHGVNRSGTEYACIQNSGIFDGPGDAASVAAMAAWHINIVRIPLNEDCWLNVNTRGISGAYTGQNYRTAIVNYVNLLHEYGMYAELSLMWGAPGTARATYQANAPDEDHSPAMWTSIAETFRNDPNVILGAWGETTVGWSCFLHGCNDQASFGSQQDGGASCGTGCWVYNSAGMQQAVTDMRNAGYKGPIAIPCIDFANMCGTLPDGSNYNGSTWLQSRPSDPTNQLVAEAHVYGLNACDTTACFNSSMLPILQAGYPVIWGETGESYNYSDCPSTSYIQTFLAWAEQNGVGTEAWAWDAWGNCATGAMISDYNGTPADAWASDVETNYQTTFPANP